MRICFCSDLHGRGDLFDALETLLGDAAPDLVILGGDLFPDGDFSDPRGTQGAYIEGEFAARIRRWRSRQPNLLVACILGNHDWLCAEDALAALHGTARVELLQPNRPLVCDGFSLIGFPRTPPSPYWLKDFERLDLIRDPVPTADGVLWDRSRNRAQRVSSDAIYRSRPSLEGELQALATPAGRWFFISHAPPQATNLDRLPHLDHPVGSRAIRQFIEQRRPVLALHGHIHESPSVSGSYVDSLGGTLCVNPGQGEKLQAVLLDSDRPAETLTHTIFGKPPR